MSDIINERLTEDEAMGLINGFPTVEFNECIRPDTEEYERFKPPYPRWKSVMGSPRSTPTSRPCACYAPYFGHDSMYYRWSPSVYQGVQRINSPLEAETRGVGGCHQQLMKISNRLGKRKILIQNKYDK